MIDALENDLLISHEESKELDSNRLSDKTWTRAKELPFLDLIAHVDRGFNRQSDRFDLIRYLASDGSASPSFVRRNLKGEILRGLTNALKSTYEGLSATGRSALVYKLLDEKKGILSDDGTYRSLKSYLLGDLENNKLIKAIFESYLKSVEPFERKALLAHMISVLDPNNTITAGKTLKQVLEAMGPFGVKAGQFLYVSGVLSDDLTSHLESFLDRALEPSRSKIFADLREAFGADLRIVSTTRELLGAGSINYVVLADLHLTPEHLAKLKLPPGVEVKQGTKRLAIRIRRDNVEGLVANENKTWASSIEELRKDPSIESQEYAALIDEVRQGVHQTLQPGGSELDPSIERRLMPLAQKAYERHDEKTGYTIEVSRIDETFQKLIGSNSADREALQKKFSVYEAVEHSPLKSLADLNLQSDLAELIVKTESDALFAKGAFDPDGHPGNWLIDPANKRLVRIDLAQFRSDGPKAMQPLRHALAVLGMQKLGKFAAWVLGRNFDRLFNIEGNPPELKKWIREALVDPQVLNAADPVRRLLAIKRTVEAKIRSKSGNPSLRMPLSDATRAGVNSLLKFKRFEKFMKPGRYQSIVSEALIGKPTLRFLNLVKFSPIRRALSFATTKRLDTPARLVRGCPEAFGAFRR